MGVIWHIGMTGTSGSSGHLTWENLSFRIFSISICLRAFKPSLWYANWWNHITHHPSFLLYLSPDCKLDSKRWSKNAFSCFLHEKCKKRKIRKKDANWGKKTCLGACSCVNQHLGIRQKRSLCLIFAPNIAKTYKKNMEKGHLDQCLECAAPNCWSKYTTSHSAQYCIDRKVSMNCTRLWRVAKGVMLLAISKDKTFVCTVLKPWIGRC